MGRPHAASELDAVAVSMCGETLFWQIENQIHVLERVRREQEV